MSKIYNDKYDITHLSKSNIITLKKYIIEFNNCTNINKKSKLLNSIISISGFPYIKHCIHCNLYSIYTNTYITITRHHMYISRPNHMKHTINGIEYYICACENCVENKFKNNLPKRRHMFFALSCKYAQFIYNIPEDIAMNLRKSMTGITKENMILKYGDIEGIKKWKDYVNKQSYTNTYKYKHEKYGWSKDDFDKYNKLRAVTLDNLILKYGKVKGLEKWNAYIQKQKETKSKEYMINKFGISKYKEINHSKAHTLENYISRYGKDLGIEKFNLYLSLSKPFFSKISQKCFDDIDKLLNNKYTTYYATKNHEYGVNLGNRYIYLDYYIKELNINIEFNGNRFHANPKMFTELDCPNPFNKSLTSKDIWKMDKERYEDLLKQRNIKTFIIWEDEYNNFDAKKYIENVLNISL